MIVAVINESSRYSEKQITLIDFLSYEHLKLKVLISLYLIR